MLKFFRLKKQTCLHLPDNYGNVIRESKSLIIDSRTLIKRFNSHLISVSLSRPSFLHASLAILAVLSAHFGAFWVKCLIFHAEWRYYPRFSWVFSKYAFCCTLPFQPPFLQSVCVVVHVFAPIRRAHADVTKFTVNTEAPLTLSNAKWNESSKK